MKVAVVTHYFPNSANPWDGHSAYQTLRKLVQRCDVQVFCPIVRYPERLQPRTPRKPVDLTWTPPEVKVDYIPYTAIPGISRPLNGYAMARRLLPDVRAFNPDVILSYVIYPPGFAGVRIGKALGVPTVLVANGSDINRISDPLCGVLTRSALRNADYVATVSEDLCVKARLMGADPAKSGSKLNGCDTTVFHPRDQKQARKQLKLSLDEEIIVYVGRLDPRKGLFELVEAMGKLHHRRPRASCYLVGYGPAKIELEKRVDALGISGSVIFIPPCGTEEVATWMAAADLVTLPSYNEGCPNVVIEALSSGRPVVATSVGGIPELLDDRSGRLVPAQDVPALARALDEVLSQDWDAEALSSRHSRSWSDVADDLMEIFNEVLSPKTARQPVADETVGASL